MEYLYYFLVRNIIKDIHRFLVWLWDMAKQWIVRKLYKEFIIYAKELCNIPTNVGVICLHKNSQGYSLGIT
jgi:hypothetical protein